MADNSSNSPFELFCFHYLYLVVEVFEYRTDGLQYVDIGNCVFVLFVPVVEGLDVDGDLLDDLPQHVELLPEDDRWDRPVTVLLTEEHLPSQKHMLH